MPPPRLQPQRLIHSSTCQWSASTRAQVLSESIVAARYFHTSPRSFEGNLSEKKLKPQRSTRLRREMAAWLTGPGFKFRRQFPGSTNYLSAYDKMGNLMRRGSRRDEIDPQEESRREERALKEEDEQELDEAERHARAEGRAADRARREAQLKHTPRERISDMRPYPLNRDFRSEPVLSEELREELYRQIVIKKMDLQGVSAAYGVDMRRVAAVVRLKTVEKQWIEEVSPTT
jgi:hypothetical protein